MEKKRGVSPPRERSEEDLRQERREYALMERRHRMALIGMEFEALLFSEEQDERVRSHALRIFIASLDPSLALVYEKIVERHQKRRQESQKLATWLKMKTGKEHPTSMQLGTTFFAQVAPREQQKGIVTVTLEQGYIFVSAESEEDFTNMTQMNNVVGIFNIISLPEKGKSRLLTPVNYVYASSGISAEQIAVHEKQHYINHCLLGNSDLDRSAPFTRVSHITPAKKGDPVSRQTQLREAVFREIKDEVLCFTKEGDTASAFIHALHTHYNDSILSSLPKEQREQAEKRTKEVIKLLETVPLWVMGEQGRSLLVQLLYAIQFERVQQWIPLLKTHYETRIAEVREPLTRLKRQLLNAMEESHYATNNDAFVEQEKATLEEAKQVFQTFHRRMVGTSYKEPQIWRPNEMFLLERSYMIAFLCSKEPEVFKARINECLVTLERICAKRVAAQTLSKRARFTAPSGAMDEASVKMTGKWLSNIEQDPLTNVAVSALCRTFTAKKPIVLLPVQDISGTRGIRHLKRALEQATKTVYGDRTTLHYHLIRISEKKIELDISYDFFQDGTQKTTTRNPITLYLKESV